MKISLDEVEIKKNIIKIIREYDSKPTGITKTELARIYAERWGTSKTTLWPYMQELIEMGRIELNLVKKHQKALFLVKK